ncbi:7987_t:CDS:2, partial [Gigaspora margarita]
MISQINLTLAMKVSKTKVTKELAELEINNLEEIYLETTQNNLNNLESFMEEFINFSRFEELIL